MARSLYFVAGSKADSEEDTAPKDSSAHSKEKSAWEEVAVGSMAAVVDLEMVALELAKSVVVTAVEHLLVHNMVDYMVGYMVDHTGCMAGCMVDSMEDCFVAKEVAVLAGVGNHSMALQGQVVDRQPQAGLGSVAAFAAEDHLARSLGEVLRMSLVMEMASGALEAVGLEEENQVHLQDEATRMASERLLAEGEHLEEESLVRSLV
jgi:hypothetical protein